MTLLDAIRRHAGLDFHVLSTLLMRSWSIVSGAVMVVFIPFWFTQQEQGYYVTFSSLIALQVFFELGFNSIIVQYAGHEMAHLRFSADGTLQGNQKQLDRLASLARLLAKWYAVIAVLFFIGVGAAGAWFFYNHGELSLNSWLPAWLLLVLFSAVGLLMSPFLALAEGLGLVGQVARLRMIQGVWGSLLLWSGLTGNAGLIAMPIPAIVATIFTAKWLGGYGRFIFNLIQTPVSKNTEKISWCQEIFPFQWRIALSWISGYLIFQLFNPMIFAHQGAVAAGKVGITLLIFSSLLSLSMSWLNAKVPVMTGHIARGERAELDRLFWSMFIRSGIFNLLGCCFSLLAAYVLQRMGVKLAERLADLPVMACIAVVSVVNHLIFSLATYMRAHRIEPMLFNSMVTGLFALLVVYFASMHGVLLTMLLYMLVVVGVAFPWTVILFLNFYRNRQPGVSGVMYE